jgi:serine/threonine protein kinase
MPQKPGRKSDREFAMLSRLNHPAIIKLLDIVNCPSHRCFVMEYAPLGTLLEHVRSKKRLAEKEAAPIAYQLADALSYCHIRLVSPHKQL